MKPTILLLVVAACGNTSDHVPPDAPPADELAGYPTIGKDGQAGFELDFGSMDRIVAERANTGIGGAVRSTAPRVASVTADDAIIAISSFTLDPDVPQRFSFGIHAAGSGDTDIVLRDAGGVEIDRATCHVRPTDTLAIARPWGGGDALILAGAVERMHVTTITDGKVTAGSGAASFTLTGALTPATAADAPYFASEGDQTFVRAGATGSGTITADAPNTTTAVSISIVQAQDLTAITRSAAALRFGHDHVGIVGIGATAGSAAVYGPQCTWTTLAGLAVTLDSVFGDLDNLGLQTGWIGADPAFVYSVKGSPGTYQPTCTLPGGLTTTISVVIDP